MNSGWRSRVLDISGPSTACAGLAILPVTAYHYIGWNLGQLDPGPGTALLGKLIDRGALGVTLFFVLSGYLITGILLDAKGREHWIGLFLARRALRIFPLYYLALIAIFFVAPISSAANRAGYMELSQRTRDISGPIRPISSSSRRTPGRGAARPRARRASI